MRASWRAMRRAGAATLVALLCGLPAASAETPAPAACRGALAGTYLATIHTEAGAFASRALVTLHGDGTLIIADSRQHQGLHGSSFSAQQGGYRCAGPRAAQASVLNFGFPPQESIARSDWSFTYDPATTAVSGTIALYIFSGVAGVDAYAASGKRMGVFKFTSVRVVPAAR